VRIAMILVRHPQTRVSPVLPEVARLLREWGADVDVIEPDETVTDLGQLRVEHDLYVLKSGTDLALSLAGALHAQGATIVNPYPAALACRDKVVATRILQEAGAPVPQTWVTTRPWQLAGLLEDGPLVVKPTRGSQGRGVTVVRAEGDLSDLPELSPEPLLVQRWQQPDGQDRKIYCIGDQVYGVLRRFPAKTFEEKLGEPYPLSAEIREIVLRCGEAFGLRLFGLDIVESNGRPYVVDFSSFPGFKGVPDVALRLADYVYGVARAAADAAGPRHALVGAGATGRWR
jgi:ribosomal protein S6--L-glutamate ligase